MLGEAYPDLRYTIAGRTHPKVLIREGETYRRRLEQLVRTLGLQRRVEFIDGYMPENLLHDLLLDATIVVMPYDSTEQMVSGVLVEAVSANVPVVATAFPHALELAGEGAVVTVPHRSPEALARSIAHLLDSPAALDEMSGAQRRLAPGLEWTNVAFQYEMLASSLVNGSITMTHVPPAS
jgi:glycosyltransferase involved in cell wall biosynthesis